MPYSELHFKRAWAEISLDRLKKNALYCPSLLPPSCQPMYVVKANAYGHGAVKTAELLSGELNAGWFAVSSLDEAAELRHAKIPGEILILGYTPPQYAGELISCGVVQAVTDLEYAKALSCEAIKAGGRIRVHTAIDTGMTRIGLGSGGSCGRAVKEAYSISSLPGLLAEGIFSHLSSADGAGESDREFTASQIKSFLQIKKELARLGFVPRYSHILNSAGAYIQPGEVSSFARFGIMLYGISPSPDICLDGKIEPVMELKALVAQVKEVPGGVPVSYGRSYVTGGRTRIATVTVGYGDGYPRLLSNRGRVLIRGKSAPIIGRVCMDQLMVDASGIDGVTAGDTVTLIGRDGGECISAWELAGSCSMIAYEIVCAVAERVPRIYIREK